MSGAAHGVGGDDRGGSGSRGHDGEPADRAPRPVREVAAALIIVGGRVLVQTRPDGRSWPGWWEFPGGKLEVGESVGDCAERECREELALPVRALALFQDVHWATPGPIVHVSFVLCEPLDPAAVPQPLEGQRLLWAGPEELPALRFLPANLALLPRLAERLRALSSS